MSPREALERIKSARERELEARCEALQDALVDALEAASIHRGSPMDTHGRRTRLLLRASKVLLEHGDPARGGLVDANARVLAQGGAS